MPEPRKTTDEDANRGGEIMELDAVAAGPSGFMNGRSGGSGQRALEVVSRRPDHIEALLTLARAARARAIRGRAQGSGAHWRAFAGRT